MEPMSTIEATHEAEPIATHVVRGGGGLRLHVQEWGDPHGPALVFVHGWSQSKECWSRQTSGTLADSFRLVAFDLRGHGRSEKPVDAGSYLDPQLWADDLNAVIEQLAVRRPVLVASSYGGFVVTDYLRAYGEQAIAGVDLAGGAVLLTPAFDHIGPGFLENAGDAGGPDPAANIAAILRFLRACTARPLDTDTFTSALCWNMVVPPGVRAALLAREIDADRVLSGLSLPVLVTHGLADAIVLPSMAEHVLAVCGTARASWYEDIGHLPFLEARERFDRELAELAGTGRV